MTREIENIVCQESSITTLPDPGPTLNAPEPTLNFAGPTLNAPGPSPAPEPTLTTPEPTLTAPELTLTAPVLTSPSPEPTLTAPGPHPASLTAPEDDSQILRMTLAVLNDVKVKKAWNFINICQFCHRSFYKLDKHFLEKKGPCSKKNPVENIGQQKKQRTCTNWLRMSLQTGRKTSPIL